MESTSIYAALAAVQSELKAPKGQMNTFGGYRYRSCEDILEAVKPILKAHNLLLTLSDEPKVLEGWHYIEATAKLESLDGGCISVKAYAREPEQKTKMPNSKKRTCAVRRRLSRTTGNRCCPTGTWKGAETVSKPIFEQPAGYRFRADGVQMSLDWRTNFGAEKTAALQKAQFATAQKAAALIDQYVPFDTGISKNSVNQASKFDEGLLVYNTPYARRQFYLHPEGECLHGENGLRGSYWGQRALADYGEAIAYIATQAVTTFWGG